MRNSLAASEEPQQKRRQAEYHRADYDQSEKRNTHASLFTATQGMKRPAGGWCSVPRAKGSRSTEGGRYREREYVDDTPIATGRYRGIPDSQKKTPDRECGFGKLICKYTPTNFCPSSFTRRSRRRDSDRFWNVPRCYQSDAGCCIRCRLASCGAGRRWFGGTTLVRDCSPSSRRQQLQTVYFRSCDSSGSHCPVNFSQNTQNKTMIALPSVENVPDR